MRVAFAGTPPFAARILEALAAAGHEIVMVLTQPDRPAGRGMRLASSAVAQAAARHAIPTLKPASLKDGETELRLREARPDALVVAAYGLILPAALLEIAEYGCLNVHASLLPRWRGAAPIQRALLAGDTNTGVSIMQMDAGLDTGPVLLERQVAIGARDTTATLTEALGALGAQAIVQALEQLETLAPRPQDATLATYAPKIGKAEARIDWSQSNVVVDRLVRAFDPVPGAETGFDSKTLKIWQACPDPGSGAPGQVLECEAGRLVIACGEGALRVLQVQRPGGKRLATRDFLSGTHVARGMRLSAPPSVA